MDPQAKTADRQAEAIRDARRACRLAVAVPLAVELVAVPLVFLITDPTAFWLLAVVPLAFLSSGALVSTQLTNGLEAGIRRSLVRRYSSLAVILAVASIPTNVAVWTFRLFH